MTRCLALLAFALVAPGARAATTLSVTTLNLKYFGLNGSPDNQPSDEARDPTINAYLDQNRLRSEVMVFEEIVDVPRLESGIVGPDYNCTSYDNPSEIHQHVVVCVKSGLRFDLAPDDDNYLLEDVTLDNIKYRPAVHGIVGLVGGADLFHLVGVHLKAMPECGDIRVKQTQIIHDYLAQDRKSTRLNSSH